RYQQCVLVCMNQSTSNSIRPPSFEPSARIRRSTASMAFLRTSRNSWLGRSSLASLSAMKSGFSTRNIVRLLECGPQAGVDDDRATRQEGGLASCSPSEWPSPRGVYHNGYKRAGPPGRLGYESTNFFSRPVARSAVAYLVLPATHLLNSH